MTSPTHNTDDEQIDPTLPAAIHRQMGSAGVRLNEAHTHLSALRTATTPGKQAPADVTAAELDALVSELTAVRDQIEEALALATDAEDELQRDDSSDSERDRPAPVHSQEMLWNTVRADTQSN